MFLTKKKQRVLKSFTLEDLKNPVTKESITEALIRRQELPEGILFDPEDKAYEAARDKEDEGIRSLDFKV